MLKKKLLLADDDLDDRNFFYEFFEDRSDIELLPAAENGLQVIELLNSFQDINEFPDLIVLDHNMPQMNGKQTLEHLKADFRYSTIPIIIYSTYTNKQLIDEYTLSGACMVATKPTSYEGYRKMINDFLNTLQPAAGSN